MLDVRNLIFPMTAGDLVQSAVIMGVEERGDGAEMHMLEVLDVGDVVDGPEGKIWIVLRDQATLERFQVELFKDTPLLVTDIRRS